MGGRGLFVFDRGRFADTTHPTFANLDEDPAGPDSTVPLMKAE